MRTSAEASQRLRFLDFADQLGVSLNPGSNTLLSLIAQHMLQLDLPPDWSQEEGYKGELYFFNRVTGDSSWTHPQASLYKDILDEVSSWPADADAEDVYRRSWGYLQKAQLAAAQALSQWSGPHCIGAGRRPDLASQPADELDRYFFNMTTGEYARGDPRRMLEFDLLQQHMLLSYCIHYAGQSRHRARPDATASPGHGSSEESLASVGGGGSEAETQGSAPPSPRIQVFAPGATRKPKVTLPVPARRHLEKESPQATPRRCLIVPTAGDESVKSQMSFYSALSSCSEEAAGVDDFSSSPGAAAVC